MKTKIFFLLHIVMFSFLIINAQSEFSLEEYDVFLKSIKDLTYTEISELHPLQQDYYSEIERTNGISDIYYLDSVMQKYELTENEIELLDKNHFLASERLSFSSFGAAFADIFHKDLPVFLSTDAILHALHRSYDEILIDIEQSLLEPNLKEICDKLYNEYNLLFKKYKDTNDTLFYNALVDVDVYITVAKSLIYDAVQTPNVASASTISDILDAIDKEQFVMMPLFTQKPRNLDFSQFRVRGHYEEILEEYFRTMMWFGRIDFSLTLTDLDSLSILDSKRMNYGAVMLNELLDIASVNNILKINEEIIVSLVGESDNLTPAELSSILDKLDITDADELLNESTYDSFQEELISNDNYGQKILSDVIIANPFSSEPDPLPVSYKLMGQRFIIDSYIFHNVVYDRIIYNGSKILRLMPDPLDAAFVLGNNDALPLLEDELNTYHYNSQLASLRYLVDKYDDNFWNVSLYNTWLNAIRKLNPSEDDPSLPLFMKTDAWRMEKINTQLASWAQLRHDNLLYAKQSYTSGWICSFPHSYVEPYPEFYKQIANFAKNAKIIFSDLEITDYRVENIISYFDKLITHMEFLTQISEKEIQSLPFSESDIEKLQKMLIKNDFQMCGEPPYSGWFFELFYNYDHGMESDYIVADVHTQPTDEAGNMVGKVLHVGVGKVNLGVFLAPSPSFSFKYVAFVGPVMSYYEKITKNFDRLTDSRWEEMVNDDSLPDRPDWTNIYLADDFGEKKEPGKTLPYTLKYSYTVDVKDMERKQLYIFPNPAASYLKIQPFGEQINEISILSADGKMMLKQILPEQSEEIDLSGLPSGLYILKVITANNNYTTKILKE